MTKSPPFGPMIKAARLGFRWSPRHGAFIRMSDAGDRFRIDVAPPDALFKSKVPYRCWWEADGDLLEELPWLANVREVHKPFSVIVDDDGKILQKL